MPEIELTSADIRKLLNEKFQARDDHEKVYVSIILTITENVETLERVAVSLAQKIEGIEKSAQSLGRLVGSIAKLANVDLAAAFAAAGVANGADKQPAQPPQEEASGPRDATPFPAGVPTGAPPGSPPRVTTTQTATEDLEEDLTPDVQASQPVNAAPIPAAPNGAKA